MPVAHPPWIRKRVSPGTWDQARERVGGLLDDLRLRTVCSDAHCPNQAECFAEGCATFLLMGPRCTRSCRFCSVSSGPPDPLDPTEPGRVAEAARRLGLAHVVVTSVTRDDLEDGGAHHWAETVVQIRALLPTSTVEVLIPDFGGNRASLERVLEARPDVVNHNVETVPRLYPGVRPQASWARSLSLLASLKEAAPWAVSKSGLMVGLGETLSEIHDVLRALRESRCDLVTIGQYLAPSREHLPVVRYLAPEEFTSLERMGEELGIPLTVAGPFVRSSWRAAEAHRSLVRSDPSPGQGRP